MSRAYVTELVGEKPTIVVISDHLSLVSPLEEILRQTHLDTLVLSPPEANESQNQTVLATAYRIVWLCPLLQLSDIVRAGKQTQLLTLLQKYPERVVVMVTQDTPLVEFSSEATQHAWKELTQAQAKFGAWLGQYLSAPILRYLDVWAEDSSRPSVVLEYLISSQAKLVLTDPQVALFPQTWTAALKDLAQRLVKPQLQTQTIVGKKVTTTALAKLMALHLQRLGGPLFEVHPQVVGETITFSPATTTLCVESLEEIVASLTSMLKVMAVQANSSPHFELQLPVSPIKSGQPLIPAPQTQSFSSQVAPQIATPPPQPLELKPAPFPTPKELKIPPKTPIQVPAHHATSVKKAQEPARPVLSSAPPVKPITQPPIKAPETVIRLATPPAKPATEITPPAPAKTVAPESLVDLDADLTRLFQKYRSLQKIDQVQNIAAVTKSVATRGLRKRKTFWAGVVMIAMGLGVLGLFGLYWLGMWSLKHQVLTAVKAVSAAGTAQPQRLHFSPWLGIVKTQTSLYSLVLPAQYTQTARQTSDAAQGWLDLTQHTQDLHQASTNLFLAMTNRYPVDVESQLQTVTALLHNSYQDISVIQANLKQLQASAAETEAINHALTAINTQKRTLTALQQLQPILGSLIGLDGKKTYAVVFQNDLELRPQGGLIQAVAFVTFDKGLVIDTQVMSAAEVDATMTGVAQQPAELKRYLGGDHWAFRDSNWSADGAAAGQQVALFLEQATRYNVDGVLFMNSIVMQDWLKATGPLDLPEFKEEITDRNLQARLEAHSELQVDPSKTSDYASVLLTALIQKTMLTPETKIPQLLQAWGKSLDTHQMTVILRRPEDLELVTTLGWTGTIVTPACPAQLYQENCLVDTLATAEANVGVNKANAYLTRSVQHQVTIEETQINHSHQVLYTNKATSNSWPRGTYKAYVRFLLPLTAKSPTLSINGTSVPVGSYDSFVEHARQVVGGYIEVPIQEQTQLNLDYSVPYSADKAFSYAFFTQFQPGIVPPAYQVEIQAPHHRPVVIAPQATVSDSWVVFTPLDSLNSLVGIKFE